DDRIHHQLAGFLFQMDNTFIGVDHLLQVNILTGYMGKGSIFVKTFIKCVSFCFRPFKRKIGGNPNAPAEITSVRDKQHFLVIVRLKKLEGLLNLFLMLVRKKLVYRNVLISLAKMRRFAKLFTGTCASCDACDMHRLLDKSVGYCWY